MTPTEMRIATAELVAQSCERDRDYLARYASAAPAVPDNGDVIQWAKAAARAALHRARVESMRTVWKENA